MISEERASEILRQSMNIPLDKPMHQWTEDEHIAAIRGELLGNVDYDPSDDELRKLFADNPDLVGLAISWEWGDTEVRDKVCDLVERAAPEGGR